MSLSTKTTNAFWHIIYVPSAHQYHKKLSPTHRWNIMFKWTRDDAVCSAWHEANKSHVLVNRLVMLLIVQPPAGEMYIFIQQVDQLHRFMLPLHIRK